MSTQNIATGMKYQFSRKRTTAIDLNEILKRGSEIGEKDSNIDQNISKDSKYSIQQKSIDDTPQFMKR